MGHIDGCSEAVWLPTAPEKEEPIRRPEWVELGSSEPAPQRVRQQPGTIKAGPQSPVGAQPLERADVPSGARDWEAPVARGSRPDWPSLPRASYPKELPDLPRASYPEELPDLPCARYPEELLGLPINPCPKEPMLLDPPEANTRTQIHPFILIKKS
ncbi:IgA FC receptor-like [Mauremys mutica]|uniref:IgA FC receptor-like n=1 Tax=Mauremys mutica TaxID=74926 RepID=UPI001D15748B|nr:IgA FC receptor-like [Mauremys mutica]